VAEIEKDNPKLKLLKGLKIHYIAHFRWLPPPATSAPELGSTARRICTGHEEIWCSELFDIVFKSPNSTATAAKRRKAPADELIADSEPTRPATGSNADASPSEPVVHDAASAAAVMPVMPQDPCILPLAAIVTAENRKLLHQDEKRLDCGKGRSRAKLEAPNPC
jgi:hypothetical protein